MWSKEYYPIYYRRYDKQQVSIYNATLDNCWVVLYNPYILTWYNFQINMEVYSSTKTINHLYKYIYTGHDKVVVYIVDSSDDILVDEIQQFQEAR